MGGIVLKKRKKSECECLGYGRLCFCTGCLAHLHDSHGPLRHLNLTFDSKKGVSASPEIWRLHGSLFCRWGAHGSLLPTLTPTRLAGTVRGRAGSHLCLSCCAASAHTLLVSEPGEPGLQNEGVVLCKLLPALNLGDSVTQSRRCQLGRRACS